MANLLSDDDVFGSAPSGLLSDADVFGKGAKTEPGGFVASAKQAIGATVKGAGQAAADFIPGVSQENALKRYGQEIIEANPTAVHSFSDLADKPWTAVKEATGNALSSMGGVVGSRALGMGITAAAPFTGPAAPVVAGVGQAISWLGPVAARALPSFGGIREQQIHDDPNAANSAAAKAAAAVGAGTVGAIESRFGPEAWGSKMLTEAGRKEVAKLFAAKTLPKAVAKGAVRGAAVEGAEELAQNPVEQLAAFQNPLTAEALKDTAFSGAMGALGGGVLGGGTGAASRYLPKKPDVDPGNQPAEPPNAPIRYEPGLIPGVDVGGPTEPPSPPGGGIDFTPGLIPGVDVGGPTEPPSPPGGGIDFTPPQLPDTGPLSRAANLALWASVPMERQAFFPFQSFAAAERMRNGRDDLVTRQHPSIPGRFTLVPAGLETPVARQAKPDVQQGTGSFSDQNELANFIADERKDQSARKAALAEGKNNAIAQADQAVADARQFATRNERLSILDGVLSSLAPGQNPNRRFDAALKAAGFRDTSFTEEERAVIGRYGNVASAFAVAPEASVEPSSPGEIEAAIPAAKGKGDSGIAGVRADRVRSAIAAGFTQRKGFSLINPATGEKFALKTPGMIRAAKEALEQSNPTTEIKSEAVGLDHESGSQQRPDQDGSRGNMPTVRSIDGGDRPASGAPAPGSEPAVSVGDGSGPDAALSEQKSTAKPRRTRMTPLDDPRISKHAESLQAMAGDVGWAEVGGRLIRDANGNANARTRWIPHAEWFRAGMIGSPEDARRAVAKAVSGTPMSVKEKRTIQGMMDWLDHVDAHPNEAEALADMGYDDLTEPEQEARDALGDFDLFNPPVGDVAAGMRALGFTEEEIRAEIEGSQSRDSGQGDGVDNGIAGRGPQESLPGRDETRPSASEGQGPDERPSLELERQTDQGLADKAAREQEPQEPTKEQADRERDAAPFSLSEQSQPKPQGVQSGPPTADGRVSVEAKQPEKPAEVTKPKNEQQETAGLPAATDGGSRPVPAVPALEETYRPLIERLIRNKRVAKELGFDIDGAIAKAKAAMAGTKQKPGSFRALAKRAEKKGDTETAAILNQVADLNDGRKAKATVVKDKPADALYSKGDETVSAPMPQSQAEQRIKSLLGNKVGRLLIESGIITFTNKGDAYQGATYTNGTIALNLDALSADNFDGVLLHEGFHSTIKQLVGEETYAKLMKQLENMLAMGRGAQWVKDANAAVPKKTAPENVTEEIAAYAIEQHKNGGKIPSVLQRWVQSFLSAIRTAIIQRMPNGKLKNWAVMNLKAQDLANLAMAGLKAKAAGQVQAQGREAMAYSTAFGKDSQHRTPLGDATEIEVDGIKRPALNSNGKPIHWSREGVENFWRWFSDSKVVDAEGRPLVVYHGTSAEFNAFDTGKGGSVWNDDASRAGIFFGSTKDDADHFGAVSEERIGGKKRVLQAYLAIKRPKIITDDVGGKYVDEWLAELEKTDPEEYDYQEATKAYENSGGIGKGLELAVVDAKQSGRDGAIVRMEGSDEMYVVFSPTQIKSATENNGDFSPDNPDIRYSKASQANNNGGRKYSKINQTDTPAFKTAPAPVDRKVTTEDARGQQDMLAQQANPVEQTAQDKIKSLQKQLKTATPFEKREADLNGQLIELVTKDAEQAISDGTAPAYRTGDSTFAIIHPSAQNDGMIQVTRYNEDGVFGDSQYNDVESAVRGGALWFRPRMSDSEAVAALDASAKAEEAYRKRREAQPVKATTEAKAVEPWQMTREEFFAQGDAPVRNALIANGLGKIEFQGYRTTYEYESPAPSGPFKGVTVTRSQQPIGSAIGMPFGRAIVKASTKMKGGQAILDRGELFELGKEYHKRVVADAIAEGKPVPANVLADYPDLAPAAVDAKKEAETDDGIRYSKASEFSPDNDLIEAAKKHFMVTHDVREAGYILPDGTMLDFSGKHYANRRDWPYLKGNRNVDHRELTSENTHTNSTLEKYFDATDANDLMQEFMAKTGAMRVDFNAGVSSIMRPPTIHQIKAIGGIKGWSATSYIDPENGRIVADVEFENTTPAKVRAFFDENSGKKAGKSSPLFSKSDTAQPEPFPRAQAESRIKSILGDKLGKVLIDSGIVTFTNKGNEYQGATYKDGSIVLNLDALNADNFDGVFAHEGFHSTIRNLVGEETYAKLMKQLENMLAMGKGAQWVKDADAAIPSDTKAEHRTEEIAAYSIEQYVNGAKQPNIITRWVESLLSALRTAIIRKLPFGKLKSWAVNNLQPQDLANLAMAGLKAKAAGQVQAQGREAMAFSKINQTATEAFRKWFGDSKVVDADGKPLVVYHGTTADVAQFDLGFSGSDGVGYNVPAIFATTDKKLASDYAINKFDREIADAMRAMQRFKNENQGDYGDEYERLYQSVKDAFSKQRYEGRSELGGGANVIPLYMRGDMAEVDANGQRFMEVMPKALLNAVAQGKDGVIVNNVIDNASPATDYPARVFVTFAPENVKSAIGNNGDFDATNPDIRYSKASQAIRSAVGAVTGAMSGTENTDGEFAFPSESKMDDIIYAMQDKHIDLKRVVESIKKTAGSIADNIDPYLQEELFHGRAAKAVKDFLDLELRPLIAEMRMRGVGMADFEEYLWNRHAEERNAQIAKINPQMEDGGSGLKTADAQAYLAGLSSDKRKAYELLAAKIDAITAKNRQVLVESGLEKAETVAAWEGAYKHYVPLQREDVETGGNGTGQGFSVRGTSSKRAVGSGRPVADIIANLAMQRERFIVKAEKNRVSIAIAGLAASNPNPDFWKLNEAPKERVVNNVAIYNVLDANGNKVADFTRMDEAERMAMSMGGEVEQTWDDRVQERIVPGFKNQENVVHFRLNGEDHFVIFNEREPRAMRMAQSIKNLDMDQLGRVLTVAGKVTRYFAAINTQYNPIFGIINLFRDVQGALLNLSTTPLAGEQKRVAGYTVDALRGIYADIRAHRAGKVPSSRWAKLYEEFQNEGGQTGYRDQFSNAEQRAEAIAKEIKAMDRNAAFKAAGAVFDWLSDYNQAMENAVRLAAYAAAKERGLSKQQAASLAKNLTVNFNRKGQVATQMGALYAFFNASMQGTARLAQTLTGPMGRRIITGGVLLGSMQAMLLASAGMGDDEPPEFVRERNLILPIGDGKYISLPMPLGFHVLPNLGRIPTEFVMSGFREPARRISDLVGIFADAFNPIGNAGLSLQTIAPTVVDPFAALAENKDWTGKPIAKLDMNANAPTPGHSRAKDTATAWSKAISEAINYLSGGTRYKPGAVSPTPDQIDYLIGQVTGGVGREAAKVEQTATSMVFTGEDLPLHKVPLVGRFVGDTKGQSAEGSKFYAALKRINEHENEIKGMRKDGRGAEVAEYIRENPDARLVLYGNHVEREVQKLRSAKRDALERGDAGRVRMIESALTAKMRAFNERVRSAQGSNNYPG